MWHGISEITNYLMQILFVTLCIFIYLTILFYSIEFFIKRFKTKPKTKYYSEKVSKQHEFNNFKNIKIN